MRPASAGLADTNSQDILEGVLMSGFVAVRLNQFVKQFLRNHKDADADEVRSSVEDALAAWRQGVHCVCGKPLWVAGSAVAGYGCFSCITGSAEPDGDPEPARADSIDVLIQGVDRGLWERFEASCREREHKGAAEKIQEMIRDYNRSISTAKKK